MHSNGKEVIDITPIEKALDDVKMCKTYQLDFLQDNGFVSDNCVKWEDVARVDLERLTEQKEEIADKFEQYLGQWTFLW